MEVEEEEEHCVNGERLVVEVVEEEEEEEHCVNGERLVVEEEEEEEHQGREEEG